MPPEDPFAEAARNLQERIATHAETRSTKRYTDAEHHRDRLVRDFLFALRASAIAFTRYPNSHHWLLQNAVGEELIESAVALSVLTSQGIFNTPRRELRFLLEATVKYVYVDQLLPGDASLEERVALLGDKSRVPRSSVDPIDDLQMWILDDPSSLRAAVKQCFAALSGYVHPSQPAREEWMRRAERGELSGFEGPRVLETFNRLTSQTLDVVLALVFQGVGPSFTGDLFIQIFDGRPTWTYHRTRFVAEIFRYFDYKSERRREKPSTTQ